MNEHSSVSHGRVDPGLEPPFGLGRMRISPGTLEIACDGAVETVERRMMQVLIALYRRIGRAVSRDELSVLCWEGRIVGDDALNRIISRLRKALSADPAVSIDTIPKVGYRLRVAGDATPASSSAEGSNPRRRLIAGTVAILIALLLALLIVDQREPRWSVDTVRPLTRDPGIEMFPALSPDGRKLAYASSSGAGEATDVYLRGTALGETRPIRLTSTGASEVAPAWSPDGVRLAFARLGLDRGCEIVLITPPDPAERVVGRCRRAPSIKIDWLDERTILYSDGAAEGPWRLFGLDVNSGSIRAFTSPGRRLFGDTAPSVSPDGLKIAFRRTITHGNDDIHILERATGTIRPLGIGGWKGIGIAWAPDSRTIFFTSNRGGDFGLWAADTRRTGWPQRVSHGIVALGQISADRNGRLAVETIRNRTNLFAFPPGAAPAPLTRSGGNDWDPDVAADGRIAFGSDASGSNELWIMRPDEEPARLTQLRGSYVYSPRWSPDGRRIAFIAAHQGRRDVYAINADGAQLRQLTRDGLNKGMIAWTDASELLYTEESDRGWQVLRLNLGRDQSVVPGGDGLTVLRHAPDGSLFGHGAEPEVLRLRHRGGRLTRARTGIRVSSGETWVPDRDGIYWIDGGDERPSALRFTSWSGQSRVIGQVVSRSHPTLALRPSDGAVVAPRLLEQAVDLVLFQIRKE